MDIAGLSGYTDFLVNEKKNSTAALENKLNKAALTTDEQELLDACKQFEAYLWEQVFKGMEKTAKVFSDDNEEEGYASNMVDMFQDTVIQEIASRTVSDGPNSLSMILFEQMKRNYNIGTTETAEDTETEAEEVVEKVTEE